MTDTVTELHTPAIAPAAVHRRGTGIVELLRSVLTHRNLVRELARREITDVHAGQAGGALWVVVHPIVMFAVYGFLFTTVFKIRKSATAAPPPT